MESLPLGTLFPFPLAARAAHSVDAIADTLLRPPTRGELTHLILFAVAVQVVAIVAYWVAANVLSKEKSRFVDAVQVWLAYFASAVAAAVVLYAIVYLRVAPRSAVMVSIGIGVLLLVVLFAAPMRVYKFGFGRVLAFLLIAGVLITAAQTAALRVLPQASPLAQRSQAVAQISQLSSNDHRRLMERLMPASSRGGKFAQYDAIAADRSRPIPQRHAALQELYRDLAARRLRLQQNDPAGLAAYQRDQARYELLLVHLQADAAAAPR